MAKKLKVGDVIEGYRILKVFGPGMMAISYAAQAPGGAKVFFKQYKSPAPTVVWYDDFVVYQKELSARVRTGKAANFAVRQVAAFEAVWGGPCYFQAYEFVENGADLEQMLEEEQAQHRATGRAPTTDATVWARHVTWAKVFMAGIAALHEQRIVHADLKPANAYLLKDPSIGAGFQLKLIDMDFSLLANRRAPWHGFQGYVGTDNYRSPEHLLRGGVPGLASDVFTCGLMLYELLAGQHPYWAADQADYARQVQGHAARPPALAGVMPAPANNAEVSAALHRCLSPDASARPTAELLRAVLSGRSGATATTATAAKPPVAVPRPTPPSARVPLTSEAIDLVAPGGKALRIRVRTELGKALMRQFGAEAEYWDEPQCVIERGADGQWQIAPLGRTTNETLVDGAALTGARVLHQGEVVAVGRAARNVAKLPLTVRAG